MARKSLYEKAQETLESANRQTDPKLRELISKAAVKYYNADIAKERSKVPLSFIIFILLSLLILVGLVSVVIWQLGFWCGICVFVIIFAILPFITGLYLRRCNKISESNLITLYKEGSKTLTSLLRLKSKSGENEGNSPED